MNRTSDPVETGREAFVRMLDNGITPHFQPIVDMYFGDVVGYEVLSRGEGPFQLPRAMFAKAREWNLSWELERACRMAAFQRIRGLATGSRKKSFFINVSPDIFDDARACNGFIAETLRRLDIDPRQIVIEITETTKADDREHFEQVLRHYSDMGFQIALDDFGAGHSGLVTLLRVLPHYLKLDQALVSGVHRDTYKQHLIKAIVAFAANVDARVIGEGVEAYEEAEALLRLGVRYAQGYLLGRPASEPPVLAAEMQKSLVKTARHYYCPHVSLDTSAVSLALRPPTHEPGTVHCDDLHRLFNTDRSADHVVIIAGGKPLFLVTRQHFYAQLGGPFGYSLFQRRPAEDVGKRDMLVVTQDTEITFLGRLAMNRRIEDLYDPAVVVDHAGNLCGTITMRQLLQRSMDLELQRAASANPLTKLPGNPMIQKWLVEALRNPPYAVLYVDLDHFKEYNDSYGFSRGDEMITLVAGLLADHLEKMTLAGQLGHLGGDDFVIVAQEVTSEAALERLCAEFDDRKQALFAREDLARGAYRSVDRKGSVVDVPLVTLSVAVVTDRNMPQGAHPAQIGQLAASVKKKVKAINGQTCRSHCLIDQRIPEA